MRGSAKKYCKVFDIKEREHVPVHITHTKGRSVYDVNERGTHINVAALDIPWPFHRRIKQQF